MALLVLPTAAGAASQPNVERQVATIEHQTQLIRKLAAKRPVRAVFLSSSAFNTALIQEDKLNNPASEIALSQREDVVLGFLGKHDNLRSILDQGVGSQVLGFYDYRHKVFYLRNAAQDIFGPQRWGIAHEFTHALQDQYWGLQRLLPDQLRLRYRNSDAVGAHHALTEGDAVTVQQLFINSTYSQKDMQQLNYVQAHLPTPHVPWAVEQEFNFPYDAGGNFVATLYLHGGMSAVDGAYRRYPSSSYEIMHPGAYLRGWRPVEVPMHGLSGFAGWKQVDDDVFGAFGYNLLLWRALGRKTADKLTDPYRGDRYLFLERGQRNLLLLRSVWATPQAAVNVRNGLESALKQRYRTIRWTNGGTTVKESDGAVYVRVQRSQLTVAYAPDPKTALRLGTTKTH